MHLRFSNKELSVVHTNPHKKEVVGIIQKFVAVSLYSGSVEILPFEFEHIKLNGEMEFTSS